MTFCASPRHARALAALAVLVAAGCSGNPSSPSRPLRLVLLADSHVIGPQYVCCSENGTLDSDSIMRTVERIGRTRDQINAIRPRPDLAIVLGDITHDGYVFPDLELRRRAAPRRYRAGNRHLRRAVSDREQARGHRFAEWGYSRAASQRHGRRSRTALGSVGSGSGARGGRTPPSRPPRITQSCVPPAARERRTAG